MSGRVDIKIGFLRLPDGQAKKNFSVKLYPADIRAIEQAALAHHMTTADYARKKLTQGLTQRA